RGLLADHVDRAHDEEPRDAWEDRRVHYAQSSAAVDAEARVDHPTLRRVADRAARRGVMAPGVRAHEVRELPIVHRAHAEWNPPFVARGDWRRHLSLDATAINQPRHEFTHEFHAGYDRDEIFVPTRRALLEIMEIDVGRIERIGASETDRAAAVVRMTLEHGPGEPVVMLDQ